jgi:L-aspartate oxidase
MDTEFLVIGSGIAGLLFAIRASNLHRVTVITKKRETEANTNYAQGGIAAVFGKDDSFDLHMRDTLRVGEGLCHGDAVKLLVTHGPRLVRELMDIGANFTMKGKNLDLGMEAGHSRHRIVHAQDLTGFEVERALVERAKSCPNIEILENNIALDLLVENGRCLGAWVLNQNTGEIHTIASKITFLATGGGGQVYLHTTNPSIATGDGVAMAARVGAKIANIEFIQFHPTVLYGHEEDGRAFLISESVRGEGAVLRLQNGKQFMHKYHPKGSLAPRDITSRAIDMELKRSGEKFVWLDLSMLKPDRIKKRFPNIYKTCLKYGIDITREPVPVVPAAHYMCGGVLTDTQGATSIRNLYAGGEVACTGIHGANRLASNSLLESLVFSERAFLKSKSIIDKINLKTPCHENKTGKERISTEPMRKRLREIMWNKVGIVRRENDLLDAQEKIESIRYSMGDIWRKSLPSSETSDMRNLVEFGSLIVRCALLRKESRGAHYITDYPEKNPKFRRDTIIQVTG